MCRIWTLEYPAIGVIQELENWVLGLHASCHHLVS